MRAKRRSKEGEIINVNISDHSAKEPVITPLTNSTINR